MAVDMFIVFEDGAKIKGETKDKTFKEKSGVDVLAWSWGLSNSGTFHMGGGGGAGKANIQDLSITKYVDSASAAIQQHCIKGTHIPKVELFVRKAGGKQEKYLYVLLEKAMITSVSTGGSGGEDRLTENISINFAKVKFEYFIQKDDGTTASAGDYTYDIEANAEA